MEKLYMSAGVVVAIVLCIIGIVKLPFKSFKKKHPIGYKAIFTACSFIIAIGLSILDELYILCGNIISIDFIILLATVLAGVFAGYSGVYEGLGLKELMKKLSENINKAKELSQDKKAIELLNKIDIDKALSIIEERKKAEKSEV